MIQWFLLFSELIIINVLAMKPSAMQIIIFIVLIVVWLEKLVIMLMTQLGTMLHAILKILVDFVFYLLFRVMNLKFFILI